MKINLKVGLCFALLYTIVIINLAIFLHEGFQAEEVKEVAYTIPEEVSSLIQNNIKPAEISRGEAVRESIEVKAQTEEQAQQPVYPYTEEELNLLARMIYTEARGESYETKLKVASVALNRVHSERFSYADNLTKVITAPKQFCYGEKTNEESMKAAKEVLDNGSILPADVQVFYATYSTEKWVNSRATYEVSDGTVFAYIYAEGSQNGVS
jgi:spore germination cell wall hydrolase CwlJ-like protein